MLLDDILSDYIERFWGYGDLAAPIWFIGMEEGGELDVDRFNKVLSRWKASGKPEVVDICPPEMSEANRWFASPKPPIQRTWGKLIRATLNAIEEKVANEPIRRYQRDQLARPGGQTCLIELMPLPSPKITQWPYKDQSRLPFLVSRQAYMDHVYPQRIDKLQELVSEWTPKIVVFYSINYFNYWTEVVGPNGAWQDNELFKSITVGNTKFYCIQHPTSHGVTNELYDQLGADMSKEM